MTDLFLATTLGTNITDTEISNLFAKAETFNAWQRVVFRLARELDKLPDSYKTDDFLVHGCDVNVWLVFQQIDGRVYFLADSDSRIIKGLLVVLLAPINGILKEDFSAFDQNVYLSQLALLEYLKPDEQHSLRTIEDEINTIFQGLQLA